MVTLVPSFLMILFGLVVIMDIAITWWAAWFTINSTIGIHVGHLMHGLRSQVMPLLMSLIICSLLLTPEIWTKSEIKKLKNAKAKWFLRFFDHHKLEKKFEINHQISTHGSNR
jgi:hypothetical protein